MLKIYEVIELKCVDKITDATHKTLERVICFYQVYVEMQEKVKY
jgi:hypothetical protein